MAGPTVHGEKDTSNAGSSLTITAPTLSSGDLLIAIIFNTGSSTDPTPPSGWTKVRGPNTVGTVPLNPDLAAWVYKKTATGSEPGSYTWTGLSSTSSCGSVLSISSTGGVDTSASAVSLTAPTISTAQNNELVIFAWFVDSASFGDTAFGLPGGVTGQGTNPIRADVVQISNYCMAVASLAVATAGSVSGYAATHGNNGNTLSIAVALLPVASGASIAWIT